MEPEPQSNQRLRAYFRPVRIPNFLIGWITSRSGIRQLGLDLFVGTIESEALPL